MRVQPKFNYGQASQPRTVYQAVAQEVAEASDYYSGQLEDLALKIDKLTELLARVVESLPEDKALHVLGSTWEKM